MSFAAVVAPLTLVAGTAEVAESEEIPEMIAVLEATEERIISEPAYLVNDPAVIWSA